jgi:hypothetical protein
VLLPFATHHRFISFILYVIGKFAKKKVTSWKNINHLNRLCLFRYQSSQGTLQESIPTIRVDAYGIVIDCLPKPFHCQ